MSLVITNLSKHYGEVAVFSHVSLNVAVDKSTLLNCMAGLDTTRTQCVR